MASGTALAGSRLRISMIVICSAIFWAGLFGFFFEGFRFLKMFIPNLSGEFVEVIFSMFFLSLLIMLIFSAGNHPLYGTLSIPRGSLSFDDPGVSRPDLRL